MSEDNMAQPLSEELQMLAAGYVLGDFSEEEKARAEELLENNVDFVREVQTLEASFHILPTALPTVSPAPEMKDKILAAYAAEIDRSRAESQKAESPETKSPKIGTPVLARRPSSRARAVAIFATFATSILAAHNFSLQHQLRIAWDARTQTQRQLQIARQENTDVATILQKPKSRLVALQGEGDSSAAGTLLFTPGRWQEIIVSLGDLPHLPPERVYRMWLSLANGEALFCGQFNTSDLGEVFIRLTPPQMPPKGVKATGIFVTTDDIETAPVPTGKRVVFGEI